MGDVKGHPGYRGAGRPKGSHNGIRIEIKELLIEHCPAVAAELIRLAAKAKSEQVRVMAAKEIFDRVYGKPIQAHSDADGKPLIPEDSTQGLAMLARKVALAFRLAATEKEPAQLLEIEGEAKEE